MGIPVQRFFRSLIVLCLGGSRIQKIYNRRKVLFSMPQDTMPMDVEPRAPEYLMQHGLGILIEEGVSKHHTFAVLSHSVPSILPIASPSGICEGVSKHHTFAVLSDSVPSILPIASPSGICEQVPSTPLGNVSKKRRKVGKASVESEPDEPVKQMHGSSPSHGSCVLDVRDCDVLRSVGFSDVAMHYFTLLGDGVVPPGFLREFIGTFFRTKYQFGCSNIRCRSGETACD